MRVICILLTVVLVGCTSVEEEAGSSFLCYVPIGAETFVPITMDNICERSAKKGNLSDRDVQRLMRILDEASTPGRFDSQRVRMKLQISEREAIYLDTIGGMLIEGQEKSLNPWQLEKAKRLIENARIFQDQ